MPAAGEPNLVQAMQGRGCRCRHTSRLYYHEDPWKIYVIFPINSAPGIVVDAQEVAARLAIGLLHSCIRNLHVMYIIYHFTTLLHYHIITCAVHYITFVHETFGFQAAVSIVKPASRHGIATAQAWHTCHVPVQGCVGGLAPSSTTRSSRQKLCKQLKSLALTHHVPDVGLDRHGGAVLERGRFEVYIGRILTGFEGVCCIGHCAPCT